VGEIFIEAKYAVKAHCNANLAVSFDADFQNTQTTTWGFQKAAPGAFFIDKNCILQF